MPHLFRPVAVLVLAALVFCSGGVAAQSPSRILAIGDIHGAYDQFVSILAAAGVIDAQQRWTGGATTVVQTGDYTDRGAKVRHVLDLLIALEERARARRGKLITLLGNHEVMNILGELRDVTPEIFATFADASSEARRAAAWRQYEALAASRAAARVPLPPVYTQTHEAWLAARPLGWLEYRDAMTPRGRYGRWLRAKSIATTIDGTLFMHAGINPDQPATPDAVNAAARKDIERYDSYLQRLVDRKLALPFFTLNEVLAVAGAELQAASATIEAAKAKGVPPDLSGFDVGLLRDAVEITKIAEWSIFAGEGPLWFRGYAQWPEDATTTEKLVGFLKTAGLTRVVVGHTPSRDGRIVTRFAGRVALIDTGMLTTIYKGRPSALEIRGATLAAIYEDAVVPLPVVR